MSRISRTAAACALGLAVAATALAPVGGPATAVSARPGAPAPTGEVALTWAPTYMSDDHAYTAAQAVDVARSFDLVAGMPIAFQSHVAAMRQANPDLALLSYANATLAAPGDVKTLPETAFAHDADGRRIMAPSFGTYLMESSNPAWRHAAVKQCDDRVARSGYDGCLVDMLTLGIFSKGYVTGLPVKPGTTTTYSQAEYRDQMAVLEDVYRAASPSLVHVGNAVENSYRFWQAPVASRPLARGMAAVQMEDFLRGAGNPVHAYPSAADWLRNVDVVRDLEAAGTTGLYTTKLWVGATEQQVAGWQSYAMATFLMGAEGRSYFAFTRSRDKAGAIGANLPYRMPKEVGVPLGAMQKLSSGAYARRFANGLSVVNPTTATVTVRLSSPARTLDGRTVTTLTLGPSSGDVLVGATSPVEPVTEPDGTPGPQPTPDTTAPTGQHGSRTVAPGSLQASGAAADDRAVASAGVAVRNESTLKWLRRDGTWGAYQVLPATLTEPGARSSGWWVRFALPAGRYGLSLVVQDAAGNTNQSKPWVVATVPS